jgi:hypothetical protein
LLPPPGLTALENTNPVSSLESILSKLTILIKVGDQFAKVRCIALPPVIVVSLS